MDKAFIEELSKTESLDAVITLAKEKGFTLTAEESKLEETVSEISCCPYSLESFLIR